MKFGERAFSLISLAFGLIAAGALALAVATDFWIHAIEPIRVDNETTFIGSFDVAPPAAGDQPLYIQTKEGTSTEEQHHRSEVKEDKSIQHGVHSSKDNNRALHVRGREFDKEDEEQGETEIGFIPVSTDHDVPITYNMHSHSGLWRICIIYEDPDVPPESCSTIGYFSQTSERVDKGDTTNSINREFLVAVRGFQSLHSFISCKISGAIRKSSPVIVGSLLVLLLALSMSIVGSTKNDYRTIVSAVIYIFSALALAMGIVMYISAVNDEVSHRKKTVDKSEKSFQYNYGWAFFFCGATFISSMVAAISNISLYLLRYSTLEDKTNSETLRCVQLPHELCQHRALAMNPLVSSLAQTQQPLSAALYISIGGRFQEIRNNEDAT